MQHLLATLAISIVLLFNVPLIEVVPPGQPLNNRLLFLVDRSGSMHGGNFNRALLAVEYIAGQEFDDVEIGVIAFNDAPLRWAGKPESGAQEVKPGWAIPTPEAIAEVNAWLAQLGSGGDTLIINPLVAALHEPRKTLSIVLVTDGLFGRERIDEILQAIVAGQAWRDQNGYEPAVILCYGVGTAAFSDALAKIAQMGNGGYFREETSPEEPDENLMIPPK